MRPGRRARGSYLTNKCNPGPNRCSPNTQPILLWAVLIARIDEVFPLLCPIGGGQMRTIAFINHSADIRYFLDHIRVNSEPSHIAPEDGATAVG